jgi:hypothetical protein
LGLCGPTYYSGFSPFLNWWKCASQPIISRTAGGDLTGKAIWDAGKCLSPISGEIINPAPADLVSIKRIFFAPPNDYQVLAGCDYSGEPWVAEWDGSATGRIDFLTTGGRQSAVGANKIVFQMGSRPGNTQFTLTLKDRNNPPRNIRIYQQRYATNVAAGEMFNPDWLTVIKKFETIRLMDWQCTNNSEITNISQLADESYLAWCQPLDQNFGPRGSIHPSIICKLANASGCKVHVCLPAKAPDQFVTDFAAFIKASTKVEVAYEFSNECWNFQFKQTAYCLDQGNAIWPGNGMRYNMWYGYRATQIMQIIRNIYNDPGRWHGCLCTQTASIGPLQQTLQGITHALRSAPPLKISDLFKSVYGTGYFGDQVRCVPIAMISNTRPAFVQAKGHGYKNGQRIKVFVQKGMVELNGSYATVANVTSDSFELQGVDATSYSPFVAANNYALPASIYEMMDKSSAKFSADPRTYPNKYTYFNQQLASSLVSGACSDGFVTQINVATLQSYYWPNLKTLALANGLELRQYEGGCHFLGDSYLNAYGGEPQFTEFLLNFGHSPEVAAVYAAAYTAFVAIGGKHPSKFVEGGPTSRFGTWAGIRFWPTVANKGKIDDSNPVWKATTTFTGS